MIVKNSDQSTDGVKQNHTERKEEEKGLSMNITIQETCCIYIYIIFKTR